MHQAKLHSGKMGDCKVCTPIQKKKRERKDYAPRRQKATTVELTIRRQMSEEIGEEELSKDSRFAVMMHYGLIAPRIDRRVTKPTWMEESKWKVLKQEFHNATKGLVPSYRPATPRTLAPSTPSPRNKKWSEIKHKRHNGPQQSLPARPKA